jgi:ParB-like chromosome segregation protein Spo0J
MSKPPTAAPPIERAIVEMDTTSLVPNPRNPRQHPEAQIKILMASLRRDGQTKPVLVRKANRMLIAGHGVHDAASRLGLPRLSVVLLDVDQASADRIMAGDNRQSDLSKTDQKRVAELLREIDEVDWLATGFSTDEVTKLLAPVEPADLVVHEIEFDDRRDTFWISVHGPLADQAQALQRLKALMADMPRVEVTLGTTPDLS